MGPSDRRLAILDILCQKRQDTVGNLAEALHVSDRTIRHDLVVLSCSYPITSIRGRYGCVKIADWFHQDARFLSKEQLQLLRRLRLTLSGDDLVILDSILTQFSPQQKN